MGRLTVNPISRVGAPPRLRAATVEGPDGVVMINKTRVLKLSTLMENSGNFRVARGNSSDSRVGTGTIGEGSGNVAWPTWTQLKICAQSAALTKVSEG
ncbi:hypothetical protein FA13DRAFT_1735489 [Coprinellus micaceus]|uniref:Uncharacterized protein n=1 Tax=Coprinellus micaceus TaxID=71717 RepID=A0A4Y7T3X5_COPMI|nr:hypothetical protein FA13DRAFT_1735489 [Coprinellus micaceus]